MPIHPLAERLRTLGLAAMADAFLEMQNHSDAADLTREDWLGLLLDRGITARDGKRLARRLSVARLRQNAVVEDTDFRAPRGLDRPLFHKLAGCDWIRRSQHLVISGPTGTGKSWLACALAQYACRRGHSAFYQRVPRLGEELRIRHGNGTFGKWLLQLAKTDVLLLDDWGMAGIDSQTRADLLEIVDDRAANKATIITSQLPSRP